MTLFHRKNLQKVNLPTTGIVLLILLMILLICFTPFIVIWALNTLFPILAIQYSFWTWLAMLIINIHIGGFFKINKTT